MNLPHPPILPAILAATRKVQKKAYAIAIQDLQLYFSGLLQAVRPLLTSKRRNLLQAALQSIADQAGAEFEQHVREEYQQEKSKNQYEEDEWEETESPKELLRRLQKEKQARREAIERIKEEERAREEEERRQVEQRSRMEQEDRRREVQQRLIARQKQKLDQDHRVDQGLLEKERALRHKMNQLRRKKEQQDKAAIEENKRQEQERRAKALQQRKQLMARVNWQTLQQHEQSVLSKVAARPPPKPVAAKAPQKKEEQSEQKQQESLRLKHFLEQLAANRARLKVRTDRSVSSKEHSKTIEVDHYNIGLKYLQQSKQIGQEQREQQIKLLEFRAAESRLSPKEEGLPPRAEAVPAARRVRDVLPRIRDAFNRSDYHSRREGLLQLSQEFDLEAERRRKEARVQRGDVGRSIAIWRNLEEDMLGAIEAKMRLLQL